MTFGGLIQNNNGFLGQNRHITIYQPFSQTNFTIDTRGQVFTNEGIRDVTTLRYEEDINTYNSLFGGWQNYTFWPRLYPELTLRRHLESIRLGSVTGEGKRILYNIGQSGFDLFGAESVRYYQIVYEDLLKLFNQENCSAFIPFAVGNAKLPQHPDHFLVREAAIQAAHALAKTKQAHQICQLYFGQDQPYTNGDVSGSTSILNDLMYRLAISPKNEITYTINYQDKWAMLQGYKSQLDGIFEVSILQRDNETIYLWPRKNYIDIKPDATCRKRFYCDY